MAATPERWEEARAAIWAAQRAALALDPVPKAVEFACCKAWMALRDCGAGRDLIAAEKHLLAARSEAEKAGLWWRAEILPTLESTPLAHAIRAALRATRSLIASPQPREEMPHGQGAVPMVTPDASQRIEALIADFDFATVARVMDLLDWTWGDPGTRPTPEQMKDTARDLLKMAHEDPDDGYSTWATGGFLATRHGDGRLDLSFVVTSEYEYATEDPHDHR